MWHAIAQQLSDTLLFDFQIVEKIKLSGGDISESYMINDGEQGFFVKVNQREFLHNYEMEAENLHMLREANKVFVPEVVLVGQSKHNAFLVLNYLETKPLNRAEDSYRFGQQLANLHRWGDQKEYGFDHDNYIAASVQPNQWQKKWPQFFAEQRIGWQLQLLKEKGIDLVDIPEFITVIKEQLSGHNPKPALLHGDLWHGNAAMTEFGPICFDPACYWGDRECDLAMTELFGCFQRDFYLGYNQTYPLSEGYEKRKNIYNLYHLLNHCNLFAGYYLEQAQREIDLLLTQ